MNPLTRKKFLKQAYQFFSKKCTAVFAIYADDNTFEMIQGSSIFREMVGERGSLYDFYKSVFLKGKDNQDYIEEVYNTFIDISLFKRDNYRGRAELTENDGTRSYEFRILKIDDLIHVIYFIEDEGSSDEEDILRRQVDLLQEHYLFSMIVDLGKDVCVNPRTPELATDSQNYMDMKYSSWRELIVNAFQEKDQKIFLEMTDPEYIIKRLLEEKMFKYELQMKNMQGEYIWVRLVFNRMQYFSRLEPVFFYGVQDIQEEMMRLLHQENVIAAVKEQKNQLEDANQAKSLMLSSVSHEIRTPISAVLGMNELILRETSDETIKSYAQNIQSAGQLLLNLINDILDYSKIEAGKMEIIPDSYCFSEMLRDVENIISVKAKDKGLTFAVEKMTDIPERLIGDDLRIKQILMNLLSNSVKYTHEGSVKLSVSYEPVDEEKLKLHFFVRDTGVGMRKDELSKLFTAFERLDERNNRQIEGTGLGMSIVAHLLEQMESKLEVESVYGEGSTFSFTLIQGVDSSISDVSPEYNLKNDLYLTSKGRILVVDDLRTNQIIVQGLLKDTNIQVDVASSGQECLDKLRNMQNEYYDCILLDHFMPQMDGVETLKQIRGLGDDYQTLPVVVLSANVMVGARGQYLEAGFSDFLEKPIDSRQLRSVLEKYIH